MKRKDEEFCRKVFTKFLSDSVSSTRLRWHPMKQVDEPPDYFLDFDSQRFAVEVTSRMNSKVIGSCKFTSEALNYSLVRFCENLEQQARAEGVLKGLHILSLEPIADLKNKADAIREGVFEYMRRTAEYVKSAEETIVDDGDSTIQIQNMGDHKDYLAPVILVGGKWEGEIREDIWRLLTSALEEKRGKLNSISEPKILLVLDRYHSGSNTDWLEAAQTVNFEGFHTVARIWQDQTTLILQSENVEWSTSSGA